MPANVIIALVVGFACALWGTRIAERRGRSQVLAGVVCFAFGLIGLAVWSLATRKPKLAPSSITELAPIP
jgi:hypothetical protein